MRKKALSVLLQPPLLVSIPVLPILLPEGPMFDDEKALLFGRQIADKLKTVTATSLMPKFQVKGNYPYIRRREMLVTPATNSSCNHCGICSAECPVSAINPDEPAEVDSYRCLCCFRCIRNCPQKARYIHNDRFNNFIAQLKQTCTARKEPELFL